MENPDDNVKITDLTYLLELSKGNRKFVTDMVKIFLEENPDEIRMLGEGISTKDFDLINASAHKLRSTVPFVGLNRYIEDDITEIERMAAGRSGSQLPGEISPEEDKKTTAKVDLEKMALLFRRISEVCRKACIELEDFQNSREA
jgi:HPt (histidine-containing phosphotransfer) domain-containing protein